MAAAIPLHLQIRLRTVQLARRAPQYGGVVFEPQPTRRFLRLAAPQGLRQLPCGGCGGFVPAALRALRRASPPSPVQFREPLKGVGREMAAMSFQHMHTDFQSSGLINGLVVATI
jgi:hypothetical protein